MEAIGLFSRKERKGLNFLEELSVPLYHLAPKYLMTLVMNNKTVESQTYLKALSSLLSIPPLTHGIEMGLSERVRVLLFKTVMKD